MNALLIMIAFAVAWFLASRFLDQPAKARATNALKGLLTAAMVWWLLTWPIDNEGVVTPAWQLILDTLAQIDAATFWTFALIGAVIRFSGVVASMLRWQLVLRGQQIEMPFQHIFGAFLIGRAIGFFLPSTAGLDAYKLYDASRFSGRTVEVTAGTVLEKVLGVSGIFLTFLVALPFGISIFGENATLVGAITVAMSASVIGGLLTLLWYPGIVQWVIERLPVPGKARLEGVVLRISRATAAYRDKKQLVLLLLFCSFLVHFTTASMYYFMALAVGVGELAKFWQIVFGSAIQIFATVIGPTIGGLGVREAAQALTIGSIIGVGPAIVSATLGFWVGEVPTLFGFFYWMVRGDNYRPSYCRVEGQQVDYDEAAKAAIALESDEDRERREAHADHEDLEPLGARIALNAGLGFGAGVLAGLLIGVAETFVIASGGFGEEAQVMWFAPLAYSVVLGGLGLFGGAALGFLPMGRKEASGWTPALGLIGTMVPLGLFIVIFRLRRDVYLEQMPPAPVLLGVLAAFGALALFLFLVGPRLFRGGLGRMTQPFPALATMIAVVTLGFIASFVFGPARAEYGPGDGVPSHLANKPNILLIMVDTLRADHLSCYGASDVRTPNICSLVEDGGTVFDGFSHASWTKPATASLVTSLLPSSHNAMSKPSRLSDDIDFLSESLDEHGYETGGIVSNINLAQSFGFDQGFDEYHYLGPSYLAGAEESSSKMILYQLARQIFFKLKGGGQVFSDFYQDSEVVNDRAFDWFDRHQKDRFYLFLHYMDPHDPYFEHPYNGVGVARVAGEPDPSRAGELRDLYVGEIEYLDRNIGVLFDRMRELGVYDDTIIVLTADHGEEFHEHGGWWHGLTLYEEQIHVPLLVKWQKGQADLPRDQRGQVSRHIDVAPTLIARAGAKVPAGMQGIDLATPLAQRKVKDREVYSEEDHEGNVLWSIRTDKMKLISANAGNHRGLPERELFDLEKDPKEMRNLSSAEGYGPLEVQLAEQADLQRRAAEGGAVEGGGEVEMTRGECEQLRMLGYIEDCSHIPN